LSHIEDSAQLATWLLGLGGQNSKTNPMAPALYSILP
jgi:hypothetical protein